MDRLKNWSVNLTLSVLTLVAMIAIPEGVLYLRGHQPLLKDEKVSGWWGLSPKLNLCESDPDDAATICGGRAEIAPNDRAYGFAFGGSSMVWSADPTEPTFVQLTEIELQKRRTTLAIVNMGYPCKDSYFIRRCYEHVKHRRPAFVVIYEGHNDVCNVGFFQTRRNIRAKKNVNLARTEKFLQTHSRSYSYLKKRAYLGVDPNIEVEKLSRADFEKRKIEIAEAYLENIEAIVRDAHATRTPVVLMTAISNLMDTPPLEGMSPPQPFENPVALEAAERYREGLRLFAAGQGAAAISAFAAAKENDIRGVRALHLQNEGQRNLAKRYDNVRLLDLEKLFWARHERDGMGCNLFGNHLYCDPVHPNLRAKREIAQELSRTLAEGFL